MAPYVRSHTYMTCCVLDDAQPTTCSQSALNSASTHAVRSTAFWNSRPGRSTPAPGPPHSSDPPRTDCGRGVMVCCVVCRCGVGVVCQAACTPSIKDLDMSPLSITQSHNQQACPEPSQRVRPTHSIHSPYRTHPPWCLHLPAAA